MNRPTHESLTRQVIASVVGLLIISGCDSGSGGSTDAAPDIVDTGYKNGPGQVVSTLPNLGMSAPVADNAIADDEAGPAVDYSLLAECSIDRQKQWVDDAMRSYYLFYDQVPVVDLGLYDSEESLLDDLRVLPMDQFSFVTDLERNVRYIEQGKAVGFGYRWHRDENGVARIARIFEDSPFGRAGVSRGDTIDSINGIAWDDISDDQFDEILEGPSTWAFTDAVTGTRYDVLAEQTEYTINSVLHYQTITNAEYEGIIGYLAFDRFLATSADELDIAMDFFREQNITDLVLDLRYNGGGRVSVAQQLVSQIAGPATDDALFAQYRFNDKNTENNFDIFFQNELINLGLERLAVLATGSTASASEMVINGLRAHIPVTQFGGTTRGKPYVSYNNDRCGKRLVALEVETFNANDVSVAGGLPTNCIASDDLTRDFGLDRVSGEVEGMLESALDYLVYGSCELPAIVTAQRSSFKSQQLSKQEHQPGGAIETK